MEIDFTSNPIIPGCNYHTKWQSNKDMRFILVSVTNDKALLATRHTNKKFITNIFDLIFIQTNHNKDKAIRILKGSKKLSDILSNIKILK